MRWFILILSFLLLLCSHSITFAQTQAQINGFNYLTSIQTADGAWNEGIVTDFHNASTVLETLKLFNRIGSTYNAGLQWLQLSLADNTDYLTKRIILFSQNNINYQNELTQLLALRNSLDGGWGLDVNFQSDNLDTALALQALKKINYTDQTVIQTAINYLLSNQNTDGGWGFYSGDDSRIFMTAIISKTLQQLSQTTALATAVNKGTAFIVSHQNTDGGFGSSPSTVYETALAYIALAAVTMDNTVLGNAAQYITNTQTQNGSWNEDPYVTALALQALYYSGNKPPPPAPALATVTGTVIDASTKQALKGAVAVLQINTAINATSDATGSFTLNQVPKGSQQISVSLAGYTTNTITLNIAEGAVINLGNVALAVNSTTGIIQGVVTDATTSLPLAGVTMTVIGAFNGTASTGADGKYIFTGVLPGNATITASFSGYVTSTGIGSVVAGGTLFFNPRLSTQLPTGTTGILTGNVVAGATGNPIAGAAISIDGGAAVSADAQGLFSIGNIAADTHQVIISAAGYGAATYSVIISEGGTTDMGTIALTTVASGTTTISGKVKDNTTGQPIALAEITVVGTPLTAKTATDGSYSITGIDKLEFSVRVSASGYNSKVVPVNTTQYGTCIVDISLNQSNASGLKITSLTLDSATYKANSSVRVNAVLKNVSATSFSLWVHAKAVDSQNNVVGLVPVYESTYILNIAPNESAPISAGWNVRRNAPGIYSMTLCILNVGDRSTLTESSVPFEILPTISIEDVELSITPQFVNLLTEEAIQISTNLNNTSNVAAPLKAKYEVKDTTGNTIHSGDVDIPPQFSDAMVSVNLGSFNYTFTQSGQYPVNLKISSGSDIYADTTSSIYVAPAVKLLPTKKLTPETIFPGEDKKVKIDIQLKGIVTLAILSATTDNTGNKISVSFNKPLADPSGTQNQFKITADGTVISVLSAALDQADNTKIDLFLQSPVQPGQTVLMHYTVGNVQAADGTQLTTMVNYLVKNNAHSLIYNQDGLGFSGMVRGNPLPDNITMSGYNAWPAGFSKGPYGLVSSVFDGRNIWMIPCDANMVVKIDKDTGSMSGYNNWPAGFITGSSMFYSSVFDGQNIWMLPHAADRIIKLDRDTGVMTGYNNWPAGFTKGNAAFVGGLFDGQNIWMIPYMADRVVKIDKDTGVMIGFTNWPAGFTKGNNAFVGGVFDGQNIWMIPYNADRIIRIDKDTGNMTSFADWPAGFTKGNNAFVGGVFDGQNIWMIPYNADRIIRIDKDTGNMTSFINWPAGFTKGNGAFLGGVFDGQNIWMMPGTAESVVKIDKDTGRMTGYGKWPLGFTKSGSGFYGGGFDGQNIWIVPGSADRVIKLSPGSDNLGSIYNIATDLSGTSNPSGVWSYGWSSTLSSPLHLFTSASTTSLFKIIWSDPKVDPTFPLVGVLNREVQPRVIALHPGRYHEYAHIVWTAPATGKCSLATEFSALDKATTDVHIVHNNVPIYNNMISGYNDKKSYTSMITVHKGDVIDFAVGEANGNAMYDTTGISIEISYVSKVLDNVRVIDTVSEANIDVDATSFSKTPYNISTRSDSTTIEWRYDKLQTGQEEHLSFDVVLKNPVAGENRLVNQKLEVIYNDINGNEVRTALPSYYVKVLQSAFESSITTNKPSYQDNEDIAINATIINKSNYDRTIDVKILIEDSQGAFVAEAANLPGVSFVTGETKSFNNIIFNTGSMLAGNFRAHLILSDSQSKAGEALAGFTIQQPSGSASVSSKVTTDRMSYQTNEAVVMTSTVQSTSANTILNNLAAKVTITHAGGTVLFTENLAIAMLTPGQLIQLKSYWNAATNPQGSYSVRLDVSDGASLLSTSTAGFTITGTGTTAKGLQGTISATPSVVYAGSNVSVGYTVTNNGNEDIPLLQVKILVVDPKTETVKATFGDQQPIAKGTSIVGIGLNGVSTSTLIPGTYIAILQVATPAMPEFATLSKANFEVKAGLDITKKIPDAVNVLVWVEDGCRRKALDKQSSNCDGGNGSKECVRVDLLERALKSAAISYYIVYDKDDFQRQMRNPYFTDYMILGNHQPLEDHYAAELSEMVYSGKGLLSSLYLKHGGHFSPLLGIRFRGEFPARQQTIELINSPIAGSGVLAADGQAARVEALTGATVAGWIRMVNRDPRSAITPNCQPQKDPAIVLNDYGQGRSVYYAFDLGRTLDDANYEQIAALIKNTILYMHKPYIGGSLLPNQVVPVEVKIKSLGGAFDLRIKESYPSLIKIYDPPTRQWITDNPWLQDIRIERDATFYRTYYALMPDAPGSYTLQTEAGLVENGSFLSYKTLGMTLVVGSDKATIIEHILAALKVLPVLVKDKSEIYKAIRYMDTVKYRSGLGSTKKIHQENIHDILKATDELSEVTSCDTMPVRVMMGTLLQIYQGNYFFSK
ncbi:MAG: carboxypeptidase-like regulatory domain-containing protein [Deltaproteobacteria bacterium]